MKFSEYYRYFGDENKIAENIRRCAEEYIRKIMIEQTISIGKPSKVKLEESDLFVCSESKELQVEVSSYKIGTSFCLEISANDGLYKIFINPLYFQKDNIKSYLRECEIDVKNIFLEIRKSVN